MNRKPTDAEQNRRRQLMVDRNIEGRGVRDRRVLEAMRTVPRERFVPTDLADHAYDDNPLPIGAGQTISQPYIVAKMTEALGLAPGARVLEVGTGSGYGAAVLSWVGGEVWTIERHDDLAERAAAMLAELDYENVHVIEGDGTLGSPEAAPFDGIVVTADSPSVPDTLLDQLADGGRLVIPIGPVDGAQELVVIRRCGDEFERTSLGGVRFVPLVGTEGWPSSTTETN